MADGYNTMDTLNLLKNKSVVFIGDSNVRSLYKDLLWLMNHNTLIDNNCLRRKLESNYLRDRLVVSSKLTKSRDFFEQRCFKDRGHCLKFYFVTRCYCDIIIDLMKDIRVGVSPAPDVIIMNSCLWDINRWGPNGVEMYRQNMVKLLELLRISLPAKTLFIWATALPISQTIRGGLIIKQIQFMEKSMRFHIMEANLFARNLVNSYGYDVLDFHYHLQFQISRRSSDGVHYLPLPVRLQTNLFLTHIALSWGRDLPGECDFMLLDEELDLAKGKTMEEFRAQCFNSATRAEPVASSTHSATGSKSQEVKREPPSDPSSRGATDKKQEVKRETPSTSKKIPVQYPQVTPKKKTNAANTSVTPGSKKKRNKRSSRRNRSMRKSAQKKRSSQQKPIAQPSNSVITSLVAPPGPWQPCQSYQLPPPTFTVTFPPPQSNKPAEEAAGCRIKEPVRPPPPPRLEPQRQKQRNRPMKKQLKRLQNRGIHQPQPQPRPAYRKPDLADYVYAMFSRKK